MEPTCRLCTRLHLEERGGRGAGGGWRCGSTRGLPKIGVCVQLRSGDLYSRPPRPQRRRVGRTLALGLDRTQPNFRFETRQQLTSPQ
jgi:hypothetical protein